LYSEEPFTVVPGEGGKIGNPTLALRGGSAGETAHIGEL